MAKLSKAEKIALVREVELVIDRIIEDAKEEAIEKVAQRWRLDPDDLQEWFDSGKYESKGN